MKIGVERKTVDLSPFPDLVVIHLGMRVNALTGVKTLFGFGPQIKNSVDQKPDGLLLHENFIMSLIPLHRAFHGPSNIYDKLTDGAERGKPVRSASCPDGPRISADSGQPDTSSTGSPLPVS
jgi:hypothetical protein